MAFEFFATNFGNITVDVIEPYEAEIHFVIDGLHYESGVNFIIYDSDVLRLQGISQSIFQSG